MFDEQTKPRRFSIAGRFAFVVGASLVALATLTAAGGIWLPLPVWLVALLAFGITFPFAMWAVHRAVRPLGQTLLALSDGICSFQDRDFGVRLASDRTDELGELIRLYNRVGETLQEERTALRQRELLLQTALEQSPIAIVLVNHLGRVVYANGEARTLLVGGKHLAGTSFEEILEKCPAEMREVLNGGADGIFSVPSKDETETYHLARRGFYLNRRPHSLYLLRRMTAELGRQEAEIWKRVIRIISHELNNSLAPISSLAKSAILASSLPDAKERLEPIYASIRERVDYLTRFLEGYARFARLPHPRPQNVEWADWLEAMREMYDFEIDGNLPASPGRFDPSQLQQVLINLLKNAREAGDDGAPVTLRIDRIADGGQLIQVKDRGCGMTDEVMRKALLPFYSTKPSGTGVGLPLSREIVEAHGGKLRIQARRGGGTVVTIWLPGA